MLAARLSYHIDVDVGVSVEKSADETVVSRWQ